MGKAKNFPSLICYTNLGIIRHLRRKDMTVDFMILGAFLALIQMDQSPKCHVRTIMTFKGGNVRSK